MEGLKLPIAMIRRPFTRPLGLVRIVSSNRGVSEGVAHIIMSAARTSALATICHISLLQDI